jgi:hypothetical protein
MWSVLNACGRMRASLPGFILVGKGFCDPICPLGVDPAELPVRPWKNGRDLLQRSGQLSSTSLV